MLESGGRPKLAGFVLWNRRFEADGLKQEFDRRIEELTGQGVSINIEDFIYHNPNAMGAVRMASITPVIVVFFIGLFLMPHLMFEEKQSKTLDVLLVSPASVTQLVIGKALVGLTYSLMIAAVVFALNWTVVVNWGLVLVTTILGSLFAVGLGLLIGMIIDDRKKFGSWALILAHPFLLPVFFSALDPILPKVVRDVIYWVPTASQALLYRFAFSRGANVGEVLTYLILVAGSALLILALIIRKIRQSDL